MSTLPTWASGSDGGHGIAVDAAGSCYVTGYTQSADFPTQDPLYLNLSGQSDVFVTKLSPLGNSLLYSTYLGGTESNSGRAIAVDSSGCAYVAGSTESTDFPLVNAYQNTHAGSHDGFVTKLSASGASLVYSTYLGGTGNDGAEAIAVDSSGCAYVTGRTAASDFPVVNAYQGTKPGYSWHWAVFVSKLSATGTSLLYSTYLAGTEDDYGEAIAVDSTGCAYVAGRTLSYDDFPLVNAYQDTCGGNDVFVTKLSASGESLVYSTYLGGTSSEYGRGIAVDNSGCAYVTGNTDSTDFPTQDPLRTTTQAALTHL